MELVPGEYEFTCCECDGDGSVQVIRGTDDDEPGLVWDRCDDCRGEGTFIYDEKEAAEAIEAGRTPLRTPSAT
jgi:DnaJ-class molecular chaperone